MSPTFHYAICLIYNFALLSSWQEPVSKEILRSVLVAVRGKIRQMKVDPISTLACNLIP